MPQRISSPSLYRSAVATVIFLVLAACSSSSPQLEEEPETPVDAEAEAAQELQALMEAADQAFDDRADADRAEEAIQLWSEALSSEAIDDTQRVEILESIASAHFFIGRYHEADGVDDGSNGSRSRHATAGREAAADALAIVAPEFLRAVERGAPFEEDLPELPESALDALLWYAKNLDLLAATGGVAVELETSPLVESIMEFVAENRPNAHHGAAHRYFGVRWVERPLNRNAEESRQAFERSIEADPDFALNRLLLARHLAVFEGDRDRFEGELQAIIDGTDQPTAPENAVVRSWAEALLERIDEFFDASGAQ